MVLQALQVRMLDRVSRLDAAKRMQASIDLPDRLFSRKGVKPRFKKYFAFSEAQISCMVRPSRAHQEGRIAIVTNVDAGCDGRGCIN